MQSIVVTFHGLIAFAKSGSDSVALCHPEGGAHLPVLTIPVRNLDLGGAAGSSAEWEPNMVMHDSAGEEIAAWDLRGQTLTITGASGKGDWAAVPSGLGVVDLLSAHAGRSVNVRKLETEIASKGSALTLKGGDFSWPALPKISVTRAQNGTEETVAHPTSVQWSGDWKSTAIGNGNGKQISLRSTGTILVRVTNVSRVICPKGLEHFDNYYDLLDPPVVQDEQVTLDATKGDLEVFDCVPPTRLS